MLKPVGQSSKKFVVAEIGTNPDKLEVKNPFDMVTMSVKVVNVDEPVKVSGGLRKQDVPLLIITVPRRLHCGRLT